MQHCDFLNIGSYDFYAASCSDPTTVITAENNFWEATDSVTIADEHIFDHGDDDTAPTVDFMPFLAEQVFGFITGTVINENSNPIAEVEVSVEGTLNNTFTDIDGEYLLENLSTGYFNIVFAHPDYRDSTVSELFISIGDTVTMNMTLQPPCPYTLGDFNGNEIVNIADLIAAFSKLRTGSPEPALVCECPVGRDAWIVVMDVNNSCEFNIADIILFFSKLSTGSPDLIPCELCPPPGWEP
ncbi:MAG: carboxypeptidase-like regulatory domain-containing protein [candidate division Zixibacteria bacterium]